MITIPPGVGRQGGAAVCSQELAVASSFRRAESQPARRGVIRCER